MQTNYQTGSGQQWLVPSPKDHHPPDIGDSGFLLFTRAMPTETMAKARPEFMPILSSKKMADRSVPQMGIKKRYTATSPALLYFRMEYQMEKAVAEAKAR